MNFSTKKIGAFDKYICLKILKTNPAIYIQNLIKASRKGVYQFLLNQKQLEDPNSNRQSK